MSLLCCSYPRTESLARFCGLCTVAVRKEIPILRGLSLLTSVTRRGRWKRSIQQLAATSL